METFENDLKNFLEEAGVQQGQVEKILNDGMTLDILVQANENELAVLAPNIVDKIRIRSALEKLRKNITTQTEEKPVALPERQDVILMPEVQNRPSTSSGSHSVHSGADGTSSQSQTRNNYTV